jgi:hypothetical protein
MHAWNLRRSTLVLCGAVALGAALLAAHGATAPGEAATGPGAQGQPERTPKPSHTPRRTETPTPTATATATATLTPSPSATASPTSTRTATATPTATSSAPPVPPEYQAQATFVASKLDAFNPEPAGAGSTTRFGAELYVANSNRGEALLNADAYTAIALQLARLQELGVRGVTVTIHEDVLGRSPRSAEYLALYGRLAEDVRSRGLTLVVESGASLVADYGALTYDQYRQSRRTTIERILTTVRPDYLAIGTEPTTEAALTKYAELSTPAAYRDLLVHLLSGLQRGATLVGAGAGTWEDRAYIEDHYVQLDLDFIGLHVYPVGQDFLQRIAAFADVARRYGKRTVIGEAWLYKVTDAELLLQLPPGQLYARDVFSFWQPVDQKFLRKVVDAARAQQVDYASAFWTQYFFAYLEYNSQTAVLTPAQLNALVGRLALSAMLQGTFTPTGRYYQELIAAPVQ